MQVFNVGVFEILFVLLIAFIVLGPRRVIRKIRTIRNGFRKFFSSLIPRSFIKKTNKVLQTTKRIIDNYQKTKEN